MRPDPVAAPRLPAYPALAVTVVTLALAYGVWYAYSVFLVALLREFGWSRSVLAGAFSVFTLVSGGAGPVLGALADRFGPRRLILIGGVLLAASLWADSFVTRAWHLYLAFGLMTAIGVATAGWTPAVVLVQRQWHARLGLALGIAGSGVGLGIFLVVPLCQGLIDAFGWRWAFRGLGTRVGSLPARGGLRARDGGDDRGRRRAVAGRGRAVGVARPGLRRAVRARLLGHRFRGAGHDERPVPGAELRGDLRGDPGGERARQRAGGVAGRADLRRALSVWGSRLPRPEGG